MPSVLARPIIALEGISCGRITTNEYVLVRLIEEM